MNLRPRLELKDRGALHVCDVGEYQLLVVPNGSQLQSVGRSPRGVGGEAEGGLK